MSGTKGAAIWPKLAIMAEMQERHNELVHPEWAAQGHDYYRAIWVECGELLEHFGWKWWQRQDADLAQVKLEIIDIWHFGLSELLRDGAVDEGLAERLAPGAADGEDFRLAVERLARSSLVIRRFDIDAFTALLRALPLSFDELYEGYVGKNVLNQFRQRHGYQDGSYRKEWQGREDNEHLTELMGELDAAASSFPDDLYAALVARYAQSEADERASSTPC